MDSSSAIDKCAACGKEGDGLKFCNGCKLVKYCSRDCQAVHRPLHKKACKKRAAEIYDENLFTEVEPDECPICMLPQPLDTGESIFHSCCGKFICGGCDHAMKMSEGTDLCAFCRTPYATSNEEEFKRMNKLMEKGNGDAYHILAGYYATGNNDVPLDHQKAHELWLKGGELGCAQAYCNLAIMYIHGNGVEVNMKKAKHYLELAAMNGSIQARHDLCGVEGTFGNQHRAIKHLLIAARAGYTDTLGLVKDVFMKGIITKEKYEDTLRAYQKRNDEMKSKARDEAVAFYGETNG